MKTESKIKLELEKLVIQRDDLEAGYTVAHLANQLHRWNAAHAVTLATVRGKIWALNFVLGY